MPDRMDALCSKCMHWITLYSDYSKIPTHPTAPMLRDVCEGSGRPAAITRVVKQSTARHEKWTPPPRTPGPGDRNDHDE